MALHVCETPTLFLGGPFWHSQCFCGVRLVCQDLGMLQGAIRVHESTGHLILDGAPVSGVDEVTG